jgi:RNA polymerase sigma-70 factor (ECF subfamily)
VQGSRPPETELANQRHVVETFVTALRGGDIAGLLAILAPNVVVSFGGPKTVPEIHGAEVAANTWAKGATAFAQFADQFARVLIDGAVGLALAPKGRLVRAMRFTFENGLIIRADIIADRAQLDALEVAAITSAAE